MKVQSSWISAATSMPYEGQGAVCADESARRYDSGRLFILFGAEFILVSALSVPQSLRFDLWAFNDHGANLTVQYLIGQGYRPGLDFGYLYGLLPLLVGRVWFRTFGATPLACLALMVICGLLTIWAMARFAATLRLRAAGLCLLVAAIPFAIVTGPNLSHCIEAALISNALAEQATGRRGISLALVTAAAFAKPSMAYVYGAVALGLMLLGTPLA